MPATNSIRVILRNGFHAEVYPKRPCNIPPFAQQGCLATGEPELWRLDGKWREDGSASPFDIKQILPRKGKNAATLKH
jgi:hypothetical protein